jgi:hypothetical protein
MLERMIEGYQRAFRPDARRKTTGARNDMPKIVASVMREAAGVPGSIWPDEGIQGVEPTIPLGRRFWPLTQEERSAVEHLFAQENLCQLITSRRSRRDGLESA